MALGIYEIADSGTAFSSEGSFTNPFTLTFNGSNGGVMKGLCDVRNNEAGRSYSNIILSLLDTSGKHLVDGTYGYSWKLSASPTCPSEDQWKWIDAGNPISLSDVSNISTYLPFWIRISIPIGTNAQSFDQVSFQISTTETLL